MRRRMNRKPIIRKGTASSVNGAVNRSINRQKVVNSNLPIKKKLRILVVEDFDSLRRLAARSLKGVFTIFPVTNGEDALRRLNSQRFDAVVTDYNMPGMLGTELIVRIREINPHIPIILVRYPSDTSPDNFVVKPSAILDKLILHRREGIRTIRRVIRESKQNKS